MKTITFTYADWVLFIKVHKRGKTLTDVRNPENKQQNGASSSLIFTFEFSRLKWIKYCTIAWEL